MQWISVDDCPPWKGEYLIATPDHQCDGGGYLEIGLWSGFDWADYGGDIVEPTHWAPLPTLPEGFAWQANARLKALTGRGHLRLVQ